MGGEERRPVSRPRPESHSLQVEENRGIGEPGGFRHPVFPYQEELKMENPATWGPVEKIIDNVYDEWWTANQEGICGWSLPKRIAVALRDAGLLKEGT